jgi:uncharacterized membrane protein YfcA
MGDVLSFIILLIPIIIGSYFGYLMLKSIYGKDYKKWKPFGLFQDVTFRSMFFSKKDKSKTIINQNSRTNKNKE